MRMSTDQRRPPVTEIAHAQTAERNALAAANKRLQEENAVLRDEIDEVKAMVEGVKKHGVSLISECCIYFC